MSQVLYVLIAIIMLGFIVTVHEFGHYLVGRLCGIGIVEFSVGFGPKIFSFKKHGIAYSLRVIPLGGYCAFVGEDAASNAANAMGNQPVWKRFLTVAAGPVMNFILAYLFCAIMLSNFILAELQPRITYVYENTPAVESGIQVGDVVTEVNGQAVSYDGSGVETLREAIAQAGDQQALEIVVEREGAAYSISLTPQMAQDAQTGQPVPQLGIAFGGRTYTFWESLGESAGYMVDFTRAMLDTLKNMIFRGEGVGDVMGPVGIISYVSDQIASDSLYAVVSLIFFLSLNVGIMNLLPLPALDGGRLIFLIVEGIRRKPIPPEKEGMVHAIGLGLLLMLFVVITYRDILRLFTGA